MTADEGRGTTNHAAVEGEVVNLTLPAGATLNLSADEDAVVNVGRVPTLQAALDAGATPYELCACPKVENGAMAMVVGWSPDCLLHEGEGPDDINGR